jgi:hypothetical protein
VHKLAICTAGCWWLRSPERCLLRAQLQHDRAASCHTLLVRRLPHTCRRVVRHQLLRGMSIQQHHITPCSATTIPSTARSTFTNSTIITVISTYSTIRVVACILSAS